MEGLQNKIEEKIKLLQGAFPSIAIYIEKEGKIVLHRAFGYSNISKGIRATNDTYYNVGSMVKLMTASCIAILNDRGELGFDDKIGKFIPQNLRRKGNLSSITIHELLTHSSGLPLGFVNVEPSTKIEHITSLVDVLQGIKPLPSKEEIYSNYGFGLLGLIVETISQMGFEEFLYTHLLKRLGIENRYPISVWDGGHDKDIATPYVTKKGIHLELKPVRLACFPAGEGYFKLSEYANFLRMHVNQGVFNGEELIRRATVERMHSIGPNRGGADIYGYGCVCLPKEEINIKNEKYGEGIFHTGGVSGYSCSYTTNKEGNYFILMAINSLWEFEEMYRIRDFCMEELNKDWA